MTWTRARLGAGVTALLLLAGGWQIDAKGNNNDWPQFRGQNRDGISAETGLLGTWPETGPAEIFRVKIGEGYSGISVVGDRLYTMFAADHDGQPMEVAAAFDAATGKEIWRTPVGKKFDNEFGNGPRATPTVDGDTLYVLGSVGDLAALATADGKQRWKISLTEAFGSKVPVFGFSTSGLVDGDQLVIEGGGGEGKAYAGLNKKTGEVKWMAGDGGPGYNSPLRVDTPNGVRYVYLAGSKLTCVDEKGSTVWTHDWPQGETHAMPLHVAPDMIFASGAEGVGAQMLKVKEQGSTGSVDELWKSESVRTHFNAGVVHGDYIYTFDNATLKCIKIADGSMAWGKRGLGKGSMIYADGSLYVFSDRGDLVLVEASPDAYKEKGRIQAFEPSRCWTAPTLSNGRLYLRNHTEMVAYGVKG